MGGRGLRGVHLEIRDAHAGLEKAVEQVLVRASWHCCQAHFMRNASARVSKKAQPLLSATLETIVAQPSQEQAREQVRKVAAALEKTQPRVAGLLERQGRT